MTATLLRGGKIITMNKKFQVFQGDLRMKDGQIVDLAPRLRLQSGDMVVDAREHFVIPGLIQVHTHLVQTLFRGLADDLELLDWLRKKIWPFEQAHNKASIRASAQVGLLEMQLAGTTSILDMGTVRLHEVVFQEAQRSGMRYWGGNCLMDKRSMSGPLFRPTEETLAYCRKLIHHWHLRTPLLQYAVSPRFAISCTSKILEEALRLQKQHDLIFHTHASENRAECALVKKLTGLDNVKFLDQMGCLGAKSVLAHAVHLKSSEVGDLVRTKTGIAHCPSSNLKLASGFAPITNYRRKGMKIGIGSDGAPCNNQMDPFVEMRLGALLQKPLFGPTAMPARDAFYLATRGGAEVLNAESEIGSLEIGKRADVVLVSRSAPAVATVEDPYSALVYSCSGRDVSDVWTEGRRIVKGGRHQVFKVEQTLLRARRELRKLKARL